MASSTAARACCGRGFTARAGSRPDEIRAGLRASPMDVVTGMGPVRWIVEEASDQAVAFFEVSLSHGGTCRLAERFRVRGGRIEEIEAIFVIDEGPLREGF